MSNNTDEKIEYKLKPKDIDRMDLFQYREKIGTLEQTGLGCLNQSGWLIKNENGSETWISEKQYNKIKELQDYFKQ